MIRSRLNKSVTMTMNMDDCNRLIAALAAGETELLALASNAEIAGTTQAFNLNLASDTLGRTKRSLMSARKEDA